MWPNKMLWFHAARLLKLRGFALKQLPAQSLTNNIKEAGMHL